MSWNIPPAKEVISDISLTPQTQELLLGTYIEEQDKWSKQVSLIEQQLLTKEKIIGGLKDKKIKWYEKLQKLFNIQTRRDKELKQLKEDLGILQQKYEALIEQMPRVDMYEVAMYGGTMFKAKT